MSIEGNLAEQSLVRVIRSIVNDRRSGVLNVAKGSGMGMFFFEAGKISSVEMDQVEEGLGRRLLKSGWITEEQLEEAVDIGESQAEKKPVSEILTDMDIVPASVIRSHVAEQLEEIISVMLTWSEGSFVFDPFPWPAERHSTVAIAADEVLVGPIRKLERAEDMAKILPPKDVVLVCTKHELEEEYLNAEEREVLSMVDGSLSMKDVIERHHGDSVSTARALCVLYGTRFIGTEDEQKSGDVAEAPERDEHVEMGITFLEMKMFDAARREFRCAIEMDPRSAEVRFFLGLACYRLGLFRAAADHFAEATELDSASSAVYNNMGLAYERLGQLGRAKECFAKATEANDADSTSYVNLGIVCYKTELYEEAEKALRLAIEMGSTASLCPYYLGMILVRREEYDEAEEMFKSAMDANPGSAAIHNNLAVVYELKGDHERAIGEYKMAFEIDPDYRKARDNLRALGG